MHALGDPLAHLGAIIRSVMALKEELDFIFRSKGDSLARVYEDYDQRELEFALDFIRGADISKA